MANSPKPPADEPLDPVRELLLRLAGEKEMALMPLSLAIGRNHAYLQQFVMMQKPRVLPRAVREALGKILGVHPNRFLPAGAQGGSNPEPDPELLARAIHIGERICGTDPARNEVRARVTAAAFSLLRRERMGFPLSLDDDGTLYVFQALADGLWQHFAGSAAPAGPTPPPSDRRRRASVEASGDVPKDKQ